MRHERAVLRVKMPNEAWRARLLARQEELEEQLAAAKDAGRPVELDQSRVGRLSRMDAMQAHAMNRETERRRQNELSRVRAALRRIEDGTFGDCSECGEPIGEKRLELDASVVYCIECARTLSG